jgi:large subunit ribosomal protein L31
MKTGIHPQYNATTITCSCGNVMHTRSTKQNLRNDVCSACHPFFTGEQRLVDTAGQVERFQRRMQQAKKK